MNMGMSLNLSPQIFIGLTCPKCGQLYSKPDSAATDNEVIEEGLKCGAVQVENVRRKQCKKCGRSYLVEKKGRMKK